MKTQNKQIVRYFALTFLISWVLWSPFYFDGEVNELWALPGAWGPTIAALVLTAYDNGKKGVKKLLKRLLIFKVPFKYYLFAVFAILLCALIAIALYTIFVDIPLDYGVIVEGMGLERDQWGLAFLLAPLFFVINTLLGGPIAEELGWRGYAQERLQQQYSLRVSGVVIGLLWALWHLPLLWRLPKAVGNIPLLAYIPLLTAMGVIFAWLYQRTKGSVLLAILFHGGFNFTMGFLGADLFTSKNLLFIQVALIILLAVVLVRRNSDESHTKIDRHIITSKSNKK
ncbi:CPBP family intramembrane glutamic endopeptidase [Maribacter chungangensis]|uniref:CPBP family intramembrane glutamic endopeptidase n=1 Tax=Maribacter chungangensis TaxID=1069117 RepID=A0ABW3B5W3_9FLAO